MSESIEMSELKNRIRYTTSLPTFGLLSYVLRAFIKIEPSRSMNDIAERIKDEPAVAADVLRIANSVFYKRSRQMSTIEDAVLLIGLRQLKRVVMVNAVKNIFNTTRRPSFDAPLYWKDTLKTAYAAEHLATHSRLEKLLSREEYHTIGLLSPIGLLALVDSFPKEMDRVFTTVRNQWSLRSELLDRYAIDYYHVSAELFRVWNLPDKYMEIVKGISGQRDGTFTNAVTIIKTAKRLARDINIEPDRLSAIKITEQQLDRLREDYLRETGWVDSFAELM